MTAHVMLIPASGGICWWRQPRGHDCDDANTIVAYGEERQFLACQRHREEVADLIARHTSAPLTSGPSKEQQN